MCILYDQEARKREEFNPAKKKYQDGIANEIQGDYNKLKEKKVADEQDKAREASKLQALEETADRTINELSYRTPDLPDNQLQERALANFEKFH